MRVLTLGTVRVSELFVENGSEYGELASHQIEHLRLLHSANLHIHGRESAMSDRTADSTGECESRVERHARELLRLAGLLRLDGGGGGHC